MSDVEQELNRQLRACRTKQGRWVLFWNAVSDAVADVTPPAQQYDYQHPADVPEQEQWVERLKARLAERGMGSDYGVRRKGVSGPDGSHTDAAGHVTYAGYTARCEFCFNERGPRRRHWVQADTALWELEDSCFKERPPKV